jgi:hypothetical protein
MHEQSLIHLTINAAIHHMSVQTAVPGGGVK